MYRLCRRTTVGYDSPAAGGRRMANPEVDRTLRETGWFSLVDHRPPGKVVDVPGEEFFIGTVSVGRFGR